MAMNVIPEERAKIWMLGHHTRISNFRGGPWGTLSNATDTVTGKADIIGLIRWSHWVNTPAEATGGISRSKYPVKRAVFATISWSL